MKKIRINKGKSGLVFRKGNYKKLLTEGIYWLPFSSVVKEYDMSKPFYPAIELNILLKDEKLKELLTVVEVKDNEIVLQYENGNFMNVLTPGRYSYWKGLTEFSFVKVNLKEIDISKEIDLGILQKRELFPYIRMYVVESYEKGILFVNGKYDKILDTGVYYFWKNPIPVSVIKADLRQQQMEVSGQEILTKDKAALRVNFNTQYKVVDIEKALIENKDFERQVYILMQLALREFIGTLTLDELLENKQAVSDYVFKAMKDKAGKLGVKINSCGVKDIILPGEVKDIMNRVLIAQKKAQANIITRREETASTRSLLNTARLMEENEMLFKLKEMEYVEKIADKINNISLSGGNQVVDQLKAIFSPGK
ncbi:MAG: peptidase [Bacteroidetes bacterium 4484_249]|nr:MAG: peptidase [Bacteroidetes bacterium 4484_249]